jgi:hypothetical protein
MNLKSSPSYGIKSNQVTQKKVEKKPLKQETKVVSKKSDDAEWESF